MGKPLVIRLIIDEGAAVAASNRAVKSLEAAERAALKVAVAAEKALEKAALAAEKATAKKAALLNQEEAAARKSAEARASAEIRRVEKEISASDKSFAKRVAAEERASARSQAQAESLSSKTIALAEREAARKERLNTKALTDQEIGTKVANQKIINANNARTDAAMKAAGVEFKGFKNGWEGADKLMGGIKSVAGAFGLMGGAAAVIGAVADAFDRATKSSIEGAKFTNEYRQSMLELAALKGHMGASGEETATSIAFRKQTLQTKEQAIEFQTGVMNTGQAAMAAGLIDKEELAKASVQAGGFQAMQGKDAKIHGTLVGQIPIIEGKKMSGQQVSDREAHLFQMAQMGGADFGPMAAGYMKNSPYASAGIISPTRLMGLQSAISSVDSAGFSEKTQALIRSTSGAQGRMRGAKMEQMEGVDTAKTGTYLKSIGVDDQMDPIQIADKVSDDLKKNQDREIAAGRKLNTESYLMHKGYGNQEDRLALTTYHTLKQSGAIKPFLDMADKPPKSGATQEEVQRFQAVDEVAQQRKADLSGEAGQIGAGMGAPEYHRAVMGQAFERMKQKPGGARDAFGLPMTGGVENYLAPSAMNLPGIGQQVKIFAAAGESLQAEATRVGATQMGKGGKAEPFRFNQGGLSQTGDTGFQQRELFRAREAIGNAGGNLSPDFAPLMDKIGKTMDGINANTAAMKAMVGKPAPLGVIQAPAAMKRVN